jgi:hypothetical protein
MNPRTSEGDLGRVLEGLSRLAEQLREGEEAL